MKSNILSESIRSLARSMGLIGGDHDERPILTGERNPEIVAEALAAAKRLRTRANRMKLGLTDDDILRWVKEGRR